MVKNTPSFRAVMIVISVFVVVLSDNLKSPISERQAITGALCAYYQVIASKPALALITHKLKRYA
jgi:hypothetical protein